MSMTRAPYQDPSKTPSLPIKVRRKGNEIQFQIRMGLRVRYYAVPPHEALALARLIEQQCGVGA